MKYPIRPPKVPVWVQCLGALFILWASIMGFLFWAGNL